MELEGMMGDCPLAWRSFVIHTQNCIYGPGIRNRGLSHVQIQKGLDQFKAEYTDYGSDIIGTVDFPSEAHYNLFVLKYGEEHVER
jgi:hypothetical protein